MRHQSSGDSGHSGEEDFDTVTMATQTDSGDSSDVPVQFRPNIPGAIYHGAWQIGNVLNNV